MAGFSRVELDHASRVELCGVLAAVRCVRARLDLVEAETARRLKTLSASAEQDIAQALQRSTRHANKVLARAGALETTPAFGAALAAGTLGGDHVDAYVKVLGSLDPLRKVGFAQAVPALIAAAALLGSKPEEFASSLHAAAERLASDGGIGRLERQRRATRLRSWTDRATGMWHLSGAFDPESGARLHGRLQAAMFAMFTAKSPVTAPTDPVEKQDHLRALALLELTVGFGESNEFGATPSPKSRRFGRPEFTVVIDTNNLGPDGNPTVDWGIPITVPWERVRHLAGDGDIRPVMVRDGAVIDAGGELNLNRTTRLANRAQRRALRALYATCAIPGCEVKYNYTRPHHVHWWRHGGPTNLNNLVPLCGNHHRRTHEGGWVLTLAPDRQLTIELPDGQIMGTGPPTRKASAA